MVSSENEFERRHKNCYARASEVKRVFISANNLNSSLPISALSLLQGIGAQHEGEVDLEHGHQVIKQSVGEIFKLELESCCPKKLMGFKTKHGLFEWVTNSLNLNNAFMSIKKPIVNPFLGITILKGFDHLSDALSVAII